MAEQGRMTDGRRVGFRRIAGWSLAAALLLTPLVAMQFTDEVRWAPLDFAAVALLGAVAARFRAMRWLRWPMIALALLGISGCVNVGLFGSAVVHDETGEVVAAVITNDRQEQALLRLPGGYFFTVPGMEGVIEVRCRNGAKRQHGYVTGYMHTSVRVTGEVPCARVEDG